MLAHSIVSPRESGAPERAMLFLHGILGTKANWRAIARRFVAARKGWCAVLVDLREHGESLGLAPPHTLAAAARDLSELERALAMPVGGALGHSFGGKVVLEWLRTRAGAPTEAWLIDSSPSVRGADQDATVAANVLRLLESLPRRWASREAFIEALVQAGQSESMGAWLAMNLRRMDDGGREIGPDLAVIRDLLADYARANCWDVVEELPADSSLDVVIGENSTVFPASDLARLETISQRKTNVSVHVVEGAGHWVHVDQPDALVALLDFDDDSRARQ